MATADKTPRVRYTHCLACGMRFSVLSLIVNLSLAILKGVVGLLAGSRALLAGALYSINDVLSAAIVMMSLKIGRSPADKSHAYGYGKVEFLGLGIISLVLVSGVFFILFYSVVDIIRGVEGPPGIASLGVALICLATNEYLARKGFCAAKHLDNSPALHTNAEHNRADAVSSLAIIIGVGGAILGLHVLDRIVAIFETVHICWLSGSLFGKSIMGLMDSSLPLTEVTLISRATAKVPGVIRVLDIKTRMAGAQSWADIKVAVSGDLSVEKAHKITEQIRTQAKKALGRSLETHVRFKAEDVPDNVTPIWGLVEDDA